MVSWLRYGTDVAFMIDAATFLLSASMIATLTIPQEKVENPGTIIGGGIRLILTDFVVFEIRLPFIVF